MAQERLTRDQKREQAREMARLEREKANRRRRLWKWLAPTIAGVAILAIVGVVVGVFLATRPGPASAEGPRNMISDGILFVGDDGEATPVETDGIAEGDDPSPSEAPDDIPHVVTYVDHACPACKSFEDALGPQLRQLVAEGSISLEVRPVAILDRLFLGSRYSSRVNNVAACVADRAPDSFLDVSAALFAQQPAEQTAGLDNGELIDIVRGAGLEDPDVEQCIRDEYFRDWVTAATARASADPDLQGPNGFSTPTVTLDGERVDDWSQLPQLIAAAILEGSAEDGAEG